MYDDTDVMNDDYLNDTSDASHTNHASDGMDATTGDQK
jgi:hypothetical protein